MWFTNLAGFIQYWWNWADLGSTWMNFSTLSAVVKEGNASSASSQLSVPVPLQKAFFKTDCLHSPALIVQCCYQYFSALDSFQNMDAHSIRIEFGLAVFTPNEHSLDAHPMLIE